MDLSRIKTIAMLSAFVAHLTLIKVRLFSNKLLALPCSKKEIALHPLTYSLHLPASNYPLTAYTFYTSVDRQYHSSLICRWTFRQKSPLIYLDLMALVFSLYQA